MNFRPLFTALLLLLCTTIFAQNAPSGINYQAVARDAKGQVLTNKTISLQISLFAGESGGKGTYSEIHRIKTNELGLFNLVVGKGEVTDGDFLQVPWSTMNVWMEIALDENGGNDFKTINASQLMAVPYAFHAATAGDLANGQNDDGTEKTAAFWKVNGNNLTFPGPHFIGTIDYLDFVFKTNSLERMRITKDGDINMANSLNVGIDINVGRDANIGRDVNIDRNLDVDNNANIDKDLTVGGIARFNNPAQSTTKDDGSVIVEGGVGIEKNVNIGGNTEIDGTLGVDGITTLKNTTESTTKDNGSLVVEGGVGIEKNLNVGGNTEVDGTLGVDGVTTLKNTTQSTTKDDGALVVEGGVGVEKNLNVGGNSGVTGNSTVGGTLGVNGIATFNNTTQSTTKDNGAVVIEGGVGIEKNLNVGGNSAVTGNSSVGGNATITGNTSTSTLSVSTSANISTKLTVNGLGLSGGDGSSAPYPLVVQGSNQGVWINVTGSRSTAKNFVTFSDANGIQGRIEGQTLTELQGSTEYNRETTLFALSIAGFIADIAGLVAEGVAASATIIGIPEGVAIGAQVAASGIELAGIIIERDGYISDVEGNVGVAYESGSGDYAEWLERSEQERDLQFGQIVGVRGGIVSLNTETADHFMVVSKSPIVLGNMPTPGEEAKYEKIAFMGQVPVRVVGAVAIGDYIIPAGNNDGYGIGVNPADMKLEDYARVVGVAWQATQDKPGSYVNVAVGINTNDLTRKMEEQQRQIAQLNQQVTGILAYLEGKGALPTANAPAIIAPQTQPAVIAQNQTRLGKTMTDPEFDRFIDERAPRLNLFYAELVKNMEAQGIDIKALPEVAAFFNDPIAAIKKARREANFETLWGNFDQKIKGKE